MRTNTKLWFTLIAVLLISIATIWYFYKPIEGLDNVDPQLNVGMGIKGLGGAFVTPISVQGQPTPAEERQIQKDIKETKESEEWIKQYTGWSQGGSATFFTEELEGQSNIGIFRIGASWRPTVDNVVDINGQTEQASDETSDDQIAPDTPSINVRAFYGGEANGAQISMNQEVNITMILFQIQVTPNDTVLDLNRIVVENPRGKRIVLPWMETSTSGLWEAFAPVSTGSVTLQVSKTATIPVARSTKTLTFEARCDDNSYYEGGICTTQTTCGARPVRVQGDAQTETICCPEIDTDKYMYLPTIQTGEECKVTCEATDKYLDASGNCESMTSIGNNNASQYLIPGEKGYGFMDDSGNLVDIQAGSEGSLVDCSGCPNGQYRTGCGATSEGTCVDRKECSEHGYIVDHNTTNQSVNNAQNICCPQLFFYGSGAQYTENTSQRCYFECDDGHYLRLKKASSIPIADAKNSFECVSQIPTLKDNEYYDTTTGDKGSGYFEIDTNNSATQINLTQGSEYTPSTCPNCPDNSYLTGCAGDSSGNCVSCDETGQVNEAGDGCVSCKEINNAKELPTPTPDFELDRLTTYKLGFSYCNKTYECNDGYKADLNEKVCVECSGPANSKKLQQNGKDWPPPPAERPSPSLKPMYICNVPYVCNKGYTRAYASNECELCTPPENATQKSNGSIEQCGINYICNDGYKTNANADGCVQCEPPQNTTQDETGPIEQCGINYSCIGGAEYIDATNSCETCLGFDVTSSCTCNSQFGFYKTSTAINGGFKSSLSPNETMKVGQMLIRNIGNFKYVLLLSGRGLYFYRFDNANNSKVIWCIENGNDVDFNELKNINGNVSIFDTLNDKKININKQPSEDGVLIIETPTNSSKGKYLFGSNSIINLGEIDIPLVFKIGTTKNQLIESQTVIDSSTNIIRPAYQLIPDWNGCYIMGVIKYRGTGNSGCNNLPTNFAPLSVSTFTSIYSYAKNRIGMPYAFTRLEPARETMPGMLVAITSNVWDPSTGGLVTNRDSDEYNRPAWVDRCWTQKDQYVMSKKMIDKSVTIKLLNDYSNGYIPKATANTLLPPDGLDGTWEWASNILLMQPSILYEPNFKRMQDDNPNWCKGGEVLSSGKTNVQALYHTVTRPLTQEEQVQEKIFEAGDAQQQREATWSRRRRSPTQLEQDRLRAEWCKAFPWDSYMGVPC